ncbi:IS3 family transposase [Streptomyces sp. NPDC050485]|uniref:IS3 family transposase n=1 Tax=Streptomyces sp. NPDC050485 TaxID=3365617 RepID=UPI0037A29372
MPPTSGPQAARRLSPALPNVDFPFSVNAVSEAFHSVLKVEYVHRNSFATRAEARLRIATWITGFYKTRRLHSVCGYQSPIDYERDHQADTTVELAA